MMRMIITCSVLMLFFCFNQLFGQETSDSPSIDSLKNRVKSLETEISSSKKIKITGYIQAQYQKADSAGISTYSGDDFASETDQRFNVRRGRLKISHADQLRESAIQFDVTEKGVSLKEAYFRITEPWLKTFSLQAGLFNRTFGFEIPFSSSSMEAPERSRVIQTIFPGETDLGFSTSVQMPKTSKFSIFKLELSIVNGTNNKADFDNYKDFIGHLTYNQPIQKGKGQVGLGISYYNGKLGNTSSSYYKWIDSIYSKISVDTMSGIKREYYGFDGQLSFDLGFGTSTIRAEYIWGQQPGLSSSSKTPIDASKPGSSYLRKFKGGYIYFVQRIWKTKHRVVVKYDWYDPNTEISNSELVINTIEGTSTKISKADISYQTLGVGWVYSWNDDIKITAYYDFVKNENTNITGFYKDIKDNVITLRLQYKF